MLSRSFNRLLRQPRIVESLILRSGGHELPPYVRLPPPAARLHEEDDLIFAASVAPEFVCDYEAQHISDREVLSMLGGTLLVAGGLIGLAYVCSHYEHKKAVMPYETLDLTHEYNLSNGLNEHINNKCPDKYVLTKLQKH